MTKEKEKEEADLLRLARPTISPLHKLTKPYRHTHAMPLTTEMNKVQQTSTHLSTRHPLSWTTPSPTTMRSTGRMMVRTIQTHHQQITPIPLTLSSGRDRQRLVGSLVAILCSEAME